MSMAKVIPSDDVLEKTAEGAGKYILGAAAGATLPLMGSLIGDAIKKRKEQAALTNAWDTIIKRYPDMDNDDVRETYETLYDLSPSIMKHPKLAVPALRSAGNYDTGGIPADLASTLVHTDAARTKGDSRLNEQLLSGAKMGIEIAKKV